MTKVVVNKNKKASYQPDISVSGNLNLDEDSINIYLGINNSINKPSIQFELDLINDVLPLNNEDYLTFMDLEYENFNILVNALIDLREDMKKMEIECLLGAYDKIKSNA
jgi:hypothetical protein